MCLSPEFAQFLEFRQMMSETRMIRRFRAWVQKNVPNWTSE